MACPSDSPSRFALAEIQEILGSAREARCGDTWLVCASVLHARRSGTRIEKRGRCWRFEFGPCRLSLDSASGLLECGSRGMAAR